MRAWLRKAAENYLRSQREKNFKEFLRILYAWYREAGQGGRQEALICSDPSAEFLMRVRYEDHVGPGLPRLMILNVLFENRSQGFFSRTLEFLETLGKADGTTIYVDMVLRDCLKRHLERRGYEAMFNPDCYEKKFTKN